MTLTDKLKMLNHHVRLIPSRQFKVAFIIALHMGLTIEQLVKLSGYSEKRIKEILKSLLYFKIVKFQDKKLVLNEEWDWELLQKYSISASR